MKIHYAYIIVDKETGEEQWFGAKKHRKCVWATPGHAAIAFKYHTGFSLKDNSKWQLKVLEG